MLTYESLIEQAKHARMPPTKLRGILREYLQILVMKELGRLPAGRKLLFTGGTYLRLVHSIKRFSEDLDFNTNGLPPKMFEELVRGLVAALKKRGIHVRGECSHRDRLSSADLLFPDVEKAYNVTSPYSKKTGLLIKLETNRPRWRIKIETRMISGFGEFFPCLCTDPGALFADKIDALLRKQRARHLYDILFMLSNKFTVDRRVLASLGIREDPPKVIADRVRDLSQTELKRQAETLRPFLFDEEEADLIIRAHETVPRLLEKTAL